MLVSHRKDLDQSFLDFLASVVDFLEGLELTDIRHTVESCYIY